MAPNTKLSPSVRATINKEEMDASLQRLLAHNMVNHLAPLRLESTNRRARAFLYGRGDTMLDAACDLLHPDLRPVPPQPNCLQSMTIYEDHRRMAAEYMEMKSEMQALRMYKQELTEKLRDGASDMEAPSEEEVAEYAQLKSEKEALLAFREKLAHQLEIMQKSVVKEEPDSAHTTGGTSAGEDGVVVHNKKA